MKKRDGWYASRAYPHFDRPIGFAYAKAYVSDPSRVERHSFHPFLSFDIVRRRFRAGPLGHQVSVKRRPINVAAHVDGHIFAYYSKILSARYEALLCADGLGDCVLAYRSGLGSNIEFAKSAFEEIASRGNTLVIAFDLESFFDTIDHATLKKNWARLLGLESLPADHFKIFKAITGYAEVSLKECLHRLGIEQSQRIPNPICPPSVFRSLIRNGTPNLVQ